MEGRKMAQIVKKDRKPAKDVKIPEILAPAGTPAAAVAAIAGGADAIYAGLPVLNARMMAENFTYEEFENTLNLAHRYGVKMYAVVNTLIKETEIEEALRLLEYLDRIGIDGVIVQDPGVIRLAKQYYPNLPLQVSTQLTVYGAEGARFFDELGFTRIVMPREMSIEEAGKIRSRIGAEVKLFGHGALCYAYSGQCKFSSSQGCRSGNRGRCAQPCRKTYTLETEDGKAIKDGFILATRDLNTIDALPEMSDAGIDSIKIEGRLKSPEYVYAVTRSYREAADALRDGKNPEDSEAKERENLLKAVFQRGFTGGNLYGNEKRLTPKIGKRRGLYIGKVLDKRDGLIRIALEPGIRLNNGDGLGFGEDEKNGCNVSGIFANNKKTAKSDQLQNAQGQIWIRPNSDLQVEKGQPVFRSLDHKLMEALKKQARSLPEPEKQPMKLELSIFEGVPVYVRAEANGYEVEFDSGVVPQEARNAALTREDVRNQMEKLGGSPYTLEKLDLYLGDQVFLRKAELNQIRNMAIEKLSEEEERTDIPISIPRELPALPAAAKSDEAETPFYSVELNPRLKPEDYLDISADEIVLPVGDVRAFDELKESVLRFKESGKQVLLTSELVTDTERGDALLENKDSLRELLTAADGFLVKNYEWLNILRDLGFTEDAGFRIEADDSMNVMNSQAFDFFRDFGINSAVLSTELSYPELRELKRSLPEETTMMVYGRRKIMTSGYCVFDCANRNCKACPNEGRYELVREGRHYPLLIRGGLNEIYDETPLMAAREDLAGLSGRRRLLLLDEKPEEAQEILDYYRNSGELPEGHVLNPMSYARSVD